MVAIKDNFNPEAGNVLTFFRAMQLELDVRCVRDNGPIAVCCVQEVHGLRYCPVVCRVHHHFKVLIWFRDWYVALDIV